MNSTKPDYDIALVGAGISAAYTLIHYLDLLRQRPPPQPVRVAVLEKTGEFWTGVPYGRRSGRHSLIITALKEFLPEPERAAFAAWLDRHRVKLFQPVEVDGRRLTSEWRQHCQNAMAAGTWDDVFLPRAVFGDYLREVMTALLDDAAKAGLMACRLIPCEVVDVEVSDGSYRLTSADDSRTGTTMTAAKVVLALGSPPNRPCASTLRREADGEVCVIENLYEPGLEANLGELAAFLDQVRVTGRDQVLVVGANASALEVLYSLVDQAALAKRIGRLLVISPAARFPHRIGGPGAPPDYCPANLAALLHSQPFTARQILEAVERDVELAEQSGLNVADIFQAVSRGILDAVNALSVPEQERFVTEYGVKIGRLQRRAGPEYRDVVDRLLAERRLELVRGEFVRYVSQSEGGPGFEYVETASRARRVYCAPLAGIVNCGGFSDLADWSPPLVQNLLRRGLCRPNASNRGFLLNEWLEASPECYVMGPLVAGNLNRTLRVWHAESCARIIQLSRQLASALMRQPFRQS